MKIVLGSKSPRRKELLEQMGFDFIIDGVDIEEDVDNFIDSSDFVKQLAIKKGKLVALKHPEKLVISADTIVVVEGEILAKPANQTEARAMINMIKDGSHEVLTGVFIKYNSYEKSFVQTTKVKIDKISDEEIEDYINTNEPYDKAGGYAIQGKFGKYIKKINGDFYNVMGLPINRLYQELKKIKKGNFS